MQQGHQKKTFHLVKGIVMIVIVAVTMVVVIVVVVVGIGINHVMLDKDHTTLSGDSL